MDFYKYVGSQVSWYDSTAQHCLATNKYHYRGLPTDYMTGLTVSWSDIDLALYHIGTSPAASPPLGASPHVWWYCAGVTCAGHSGGGTSQELHGAGSSFSVPNDLNTVICKSGYAGGSSCGYWAGFSLQNNTPRQVAISSNWCGAIGGDSGGPVFYYPNSFAGYPRAIGTLTTGVVDGAAGPRSPGCPLVTVNGTVQQPISYPTVYGTWLYLAVETQELYATSSGGQPTHAWVFP